MNWLSLVLISILGLSAHASPFDPPADASAAEKASWAQARCKWRMVEPPQLIGYETDLHITSERRCFLESRLTMISASNDPESNPEDQALFRKSWDIIWDDHAGQRKICRMIPLRSGYPVIDDDRFKAAMVDDDPAALAELTRIAEANIAIECDTPTQ